MSRLSREKGKRGERQWRDQLRAAGFTARRGQQYAGGNSSPDVICEELASVHFEVKVGQAPPIARAMVQALQDGGAGKIAIVASRKDRDPCFLVTMEDKTFFSILRDGMEALAPLKFCPNCGSNLAGNWRCLDDFSKGCMWKKTGESAATPIDNALAIQPEPAANAAIPERP